MVDRALAPYRVQVGTTTVALNRNTMLETTEENLERTFASDQLNRGAAT